MEDFPSRNSEMTEAESYQRVTEGLKMAADGAKQLAVVAQDLRWQRVAWALECIRKAIVDRAEMGDIAQISPDLPTIATLSVTAAFMRHIEGLKQASGGLRQMGVSHRQNTMWLDWARQVEDMREKAGILMKRGGGFIMPVTMQ